MPLFLGAVNYGADLNIANKDGWTAFHIAARTGDLQLLAYLADTSPTTWNTCSRNNNSIF
jgi:ankyrin repeat protein